MASDVRLKGGHDAHAGSGLVVMLTLVATLGGLLFGYDTAVISGAVKSIDANFIDPLGLADTARDSLSGFTISSALIGCIVGGMIAGWVADRFGRKRGLFLAAVLFLVSAIGSALPELGLGTVGRMGPAALTPFIIYRVICGVGVGIASMLSPLYIAEIAPPHARGRLISFNQMAIVLGIAGVYFVNWAIAAQGDTAWLNSVGWRWMLGSEALPAALFLVLLAFVPDTPRWLIKVGRTAEAEATLTRLMGPAEAALTRREIEGSLVQHTDRLLAYGVLVLVVGIMLSLFQQLVGINAVLYYAPLMFENMGAGTDSALLQTVVVGAANVLFTLVAMVTVDRLGRKPLLIAGAAVMAVAMLALGFLLNQHQMGIGALVAVVVYVAGFAFSWGPVVWVLLAEIFPNPIKGKALSIAVAAQWIANWVVSWSFKVLDGNAALNAMFNHGFAYYLYGAFSILAGLFVWRFVPETKGRSLEEMEGVWKAAGR
ncbi:D-xylose transporter XylE [Nitrospirillum amazonense]|uniref:SP family xylose:H+ symportor-like MFS transporter n=1 Tax=Nitrospirillum amazonense TaxID=28077 RepID=A0A560KHI6_9PROT|nr:D-xylose transporter XylE [Nitrospirillum amazonense]MDG3443121.1 D-xylose transporter XylE [Nitrospirillum amazonense]TWB82738.1 SP family xylose:H+ symportor-like MFS transporter [Nitrospirillum amazonense]